MGTKNVIETESLKPFPFSFLLQVQYILIKCEKVENICLKLSNLQLQQGSRKFKTGVFGAANDPGATVTYFCRKRECRWCLGEGQIESFPEGWNGWKNCWRSVNLNLAVGQYRSRWATYWSTYWKKTQIKPKNSWSFWGFWVCLDSIFGSTVGIMQGRGKTP